MCQRPVAAFAVLVVADNLLAVGQPLQVVGILVGHYQLRLLAVDGAQQLRPRQARPQGVAVGVLMAHTHYCFAVTYDFC